MYGNWVLTLTTLKVETNMNVFIGSIYVYSSFDTVNSIIIVFLVIVGSSVFITSLMMTTFRLFLRYSHILIG